MRGALAHHKVATRRARWQALAVLLCGALLQACATPGPGLDLEPARAGRPDPGGSGEVLARDTRYVIYRLGREDTFASIAQRFMSGTRDARRIADFNRRASARAGDVVVLPVAEVNPGGVRDGRVQTVPILCYHRFGPGNSKMIVSQQHFAAQMEWLARNDYRVIPLSDLSAFLQGRKSLPERAVVITIDDGYKTVYQYAFPILRKYGYPATVFLYTDFVGAGDALSWAQMAEMVDSGVVDIQPHSKSHSNLIERRADESDADYAARIDEEVSRPRELIERKLKVRATSFAYPYGDANQQVLDTLEKRGYELGLTVNPGGNAFYAQAHMLRRTMIYGDHSLSEFKARVEVSRPVSSP